MPRVLGDIIICTNVAEEQADSFGHSFEENLDFSASWIFTFIRL